MARGYLSGVIVGTLVSGLGLGTASVLTSDGADFGAKSQPQAGAVDVPAGSGFSQPKDDTTAALPGSADTPDAGAVSEVDAPEPDDLASLDGGATETAAQPETGAADGALAAPADGAGEAGVRVDSEEPVLPSPQSQAPEAPAGEDDLSISTDPAQPAMPDVGEEGAAFPATEEAAEQEPAAEAEMAEASDVTEADMAQDADRPETEQSAEAKAVVEDTPEVPDAAAPDMAEASPETDTLAEDEGTALTEEPASIIGDLAPEVKTNRLPSVGDEPEAVAEVETSAEVDTSKAEQTEDTRPPLEKFAATFENAGGKPLMSIVLIDDGSSPVGLQALENFPYPLSFAVSANWDGAEDAMIKYRAAGFEVLALTDLPEGAGPQDAEQAFQAVFSVLPEAVGVMEGTGNGLQSSRAAAEQLAPILLDSGHGVILFPKGLNTAQKLLAREGVPSAAVFRDFDAKGQSATVIRRFLDQAAFKASQEDAGVVMVGRLRPDTVSALLLWGLQDRANRVALAPVSAILRAEQ